MHKPPREKFVLEREGKKILIQEEEEEEEAGFKMEESRSTRTRASTGSAVYLRLLNGQSLIPVVLDSDREQTHLGNWGWWKEGGVPSKLFCLESAEDKRRRVQKWFCRVQRGART